MERNFFLIEYFSLSRNIAILLNICQKVVIYEIYQTEFQPSGQPALKKIQRNVLRSRKNEKKGGRGKNTSITAPL